MTDRLTAPDGAALALLRRPGPDPVLLAHATGFCKEVWLPVLDELASPGFGNGVVAFDQRGHGDSDLPPGSPDWWAVGRDTVAVADDVGPCALGVGHSSGAAALVMAELLRPGTFPALLLIEPIIFPPGYGDDAGRLLSEGARRRRAVFDSREEARAHFASKEIFSGWDPRALEAYVTHGLRADGERVVLKCLPAVEAAFYPAGMIHGAWDRLGEVGARVLLMAGERSNSHGRRFAELQSERFRDARLTVVPGAGHFLPMERPAVVAEAVAGLLAGRR